MVALYSGLYEGRVWHARSRPRAHRLNYRVYMVYTDLDEVAAIADQHPLWGHERFNLSSFRRQDYFGDPEVPLKQAILNLAEEKIGYRPTGAVRMLTQWRTWGVGFSPVTFYYLFDQEDDHTPIAIIPEITNTPWKDRYQYVLTTRPFDGAVDSSGQQDGRWHFELDKAFHVSPFHPMDHRYHWEFGVPGETVSMYLRNDDQEGPIFSASMELTRREVNRKNLSRVLLLYPVMTWTVVWGIYTHALRLWLKKVPFFRRPPRGIKQ